jgi:hypothetical protein
MLRKYCYCGENDSERDDPTCVLQFLICAATKGEIVKAKCVGSRYEVAKNRNVKYDKCRLCREKIAEMSAIASKNCEARTTNVVFELEIPEFGYVLLSSLCYLLLLLNTVLGSIKT